VPYAARLAENGIAPELNPFSAFARSPNKACRNTRILELSVDHEKMGLVFESPNVNTVFRHSADLNPYKHNYEATLVLWQRGAP